MVNIEIKLIEQSDAEELFNFELDNIGSQIVLIKNGKWHDSLNFEKVLD